MQAQVLKHVGRDSTTVTDKPQQDVLGIDGLMLELACFLVSQPHDIADTIGKSVVQIR